MDFIIVTALEEERDAVLAKLKGARRLDKGEDDVHTFYFARVSSRRRDRATYNVILTTLLDMGPITATAQAVAVVNKWHPRFVLLAGIACGVRNVVSHGDLLIATQVADYTLGKQVKGRRQIRWSAYPCGASLLDSAIHVDRSWEKDIGVERPDGRAPRWHKGVVASGGDVIQDDSIIASYSKSWPKLIGLEMEIGGLAAGIHQTPDHPEFLAIKAVSDFGEDKHDPQVVPWRNYACHVSAAFVYNLIRSGPAKGVDEVEVRPTTTAKAEARRRAAEREWEYVQDHEITTLAFFLLLKGPVGLGLFKNILGEASIGFSGASHSLESLISSLPASHVSGQKASRRDGRFGYWHPYEQAEGYWVKRVSPEDQSVPETVSGIDATIPWEILGLPEVKTIRDLSRLPQIGATLPAQAFSIGVQEFELRIAGETFSFAMFMSDHGLEPLHQMARMQYVTVSRDKLMPLGMGMSGVELIQEFYEQFMPDSPKRNGRPTAGFRGVPGPGGREISFYPKLPQGFFQTEESKAYSFKVTVPGRVDVEAETKAIRARMEESPDDPEPVVRLGQLHLHEGRMLDAFECARNATMLDPTYADGHKLAGVILLDLDRAEEALPYLRAAVSLEPTSPELRRALGDAIDRTGDHLAAADEFRSVIAADPADARAHKQLGFALVRANQPDRAVPALVRALELEPNDKFLMTILGSVYIQLGQRTLGEPLLVQAAQIEPQDADDHVVLGAHACLLDRLDDAVRELRTAIKMDPDHQRAHNYLGQCLALRGEWEEAEASLRRAVELDPADAVSHANLGATLMNQGHPDAGLRSFQRAVELDPDDSSFREALERARATLEANAHDVTEP